MLSVTDHGYVKEKKNLLNLNSNSPLFGLLYQYPNLHKLSSRFFSNGLYSPTILDYLPLHQWNLPPKILPQTKGKTTFLHANNKNCQLGFSCPPLPGHLTARDREGRHMPCKTHQGFLPVSVPVPRDCTYWKKTVLVTATSLANLPQLTPKPHPLIKTELSISSISVMALTKLWLHACSPDWITCSYWTVYLLSQACVSRPQHRVALTITM